MKKILFVVHALGYGGVGKMLSYLANYVAKSGYDVSIYVQEQTGQYYPQDERIKIIQEDHFFNNYYTRRFQQIGQLRKRVAEIKPDLVISFQTNQNALSVLATRGRNIPVIISERGDPYQYSGIVASLKNTVINMAEGGVFQTHRAMEYFGQGLQKRGTVIYNPSTVQIMPIPEWHERRDEIVFVARFDIQQKRQDLMVEAFEIVSKVFPNIKLGFYGIGNDEETIRNLVNLKKLQDRVIFHGLEKDIPNAIRNAKLFVLSSDYEGMPNALIEAMSVGLPCVSTDCSPGGAAELISNHVNGVISPVGDAEALAKNIIDVLSNPEAAQNMGMQAQNIIEILKPDKIYGEWLQYIHNILEESN